MLYVYAFNFFLLFLAKDHSSYIKTKTKKTQPVQKYRGGKKDKTKQDKKPLNIDIGPRSPLMQVGGWRIAAITTKSAFRHLYCPRWRADNTHYSILHFQLCHYYRKVLFVNIFLLCVYFAVEEDGTMDH